MPVKLDYGDGVYTITLNRPEAGNSVNRQVADRLQWALDEIEAAGDAAAIIITGYGDRFFCTGGDVKEYATFQTRRELEIVFRQMQRFCRRIATFPVPVIAAVNGMALGGGAELILACDLRVMVPGATIQFPQVHLGLITGWGGHWRLPRLIGEARALDLLLTGRRITAFEALQMGLINRVVPSAVPAAREMALTIKSASAAALREMKRLLRNALDESYSDAMADANESFFQLWFGADHLAAQAAFRQRR